MKLALSALLALASALAAPRPAAAQFRSLLAVDLEETYNSHVLAGTAAAEWDAVTQIEPSLRFYYNTQRSLLWVRYGFLFQLYARTKDPSAGGRNLLGYANDLQLEWTYLFGPVTALRILNRFDQGTENTTVSARLTDAGQLSPGFLTTGSKFLTDTIIFELQHLITNQWGVRPRLDATFYHPYDKIVQEGFTPPPTSISATASNRLEYAPTDANLLYLDLSITGLIERRELPRVPNPPDSLNTYLGEAAFGWRYYWNELWDSLLSAGIDVRSRQLVDETNGLTSYHTSWGPVGLGMLRYRRGRSLYLALEYSHRYQTLVEFAESTTANTDEVGLSFEWIPGDWRVQSNSFFRYIRGTTIGVNDPEPTSTKIFRFDAAVAYLLRPGISVELGYQLEVVRDPIPPRLVPGAPPPPATTVPDYERHLVSLGVSFAWPPPPPQDVRLNRRESEYEPVFNLVGGEERRLSSDERDEAMRRGRAADRERQERRRRGWREPNLFDTDASGRPIEPREEDPSRPHGVGVDADQGENTSQSQSPENPRQR